MVKSSKGHICLKVTCVYHCKNLTDKKTRSIQTKLKERLTFSISLRALGSLGGHGISSSSSITGFKIALRTSVADSILSYGRGEKKTKKE